MHNLSVSLWDLRTIPLWSKWTKDPTLYCLNKIKEIMILLLQNSRKPVRQTILLIGIIWWVQFQSSNKVANNTWIYVYIKKNLTKFQLQFQLQLPRVSTPIPTSTPEVSTPTQTPTPANLQNINSNSNSNSGSFNSNSNSGESLEYQLQLQLQLRRFQLQFQLQLRSWSWSWTQLQLQLRSWPQPWSQEVHSPGTPAEGRGVVVPRRRLDHLRVPDNEEVLMGSRQQWENLLGECRSSRILWLGVLLKWDCHQPRLTRTPIHFPIRNKKQDLQKAVDSLLEKGAMEPVHRSRFLGFYSRLFLVPKKTWDLRHVIDLSMLNKPLVIPHCRWRRPKQTWVWFIFGFTKQCKTSRCISQTRPVPPFTNIV